MLKHVALMSVGLVSGANAASAATIVVFTDPMSLDRRTVVLDTPGPDRLLMCHAPPAVSGCRSIPIVRAR